MAENKRGANRAPKKISDTLREQLRAIGISEETINERKKKQIGNNGRPIGEEVTFTGDIKIGSAEDSKGNKFPYYVCEIEEKHKQAPSLKSLMGLSSTANCLNKNETAINEYFEKKSDAKPKQETLIATADLNEFEPFDGFITRNLDDLADYLEAHPEILKGRKAKYLGTTLKTHISKKAYEFSGTFIKPNLKRVTETKLWLIE